jgi:hypothetical protein
MHCIDSLQKTLFPYSANVFGSVFVSGKKLSYNMFTLFTFILVEHLISVLS